MFLTISKVDISELETLRVLAERTFRDAWQDNSFNDPEDFEIYCRARFSPEGLRAEMEHPDAEFYFAYENGIPVAYLKLNINTTPSHDWDGSPALQLERIYVVQTCQGRQFGAELLRFTEERARQTGAEWVWLSVWQLSPRSISFYEKNGYTTFGVETFWLGNDPQADWLMRKRLLP